MLLRSDPPKRLFVGGTGRCGTHALSAVLNRHSDYRRVHAEVRFHADPNGLPGLLSGACELPAFLEQLRGRWWKRTTTQGRSSGLHKEIPEETFIRAVNAFEADYPEDPWGASSTLIRELLDPVAEQAKKRGWVEMTKRTAQASPVLLRLLPDAKAIHIIRDGRDVAASVALKTWGPDTLLESLDWWEKRVGLCEQGVAEADPERVMVVGFEQFVAEDREGSLERLFDFIGERRLLRGRRQPGMRRYFDEEIGPAQANIGRWRKGLAEAEADEVDARYAASLQRLIAADTPAKPVFESFLASVGAVGAPA
ncbi:MAG: hypothetical protein QOG26_160 [Solirubrobacterales bacterium]|nr:hypothetical protein [Solirubrobacterales bacterium]